MKRLALFVIPMKWLSHPKNGVNCCRLPLLTTTSSWARTRVMMTPDAGPSIRRDRQCVRHYRYDL